MSDYTRHSYVCFFAFLFVAVTCCAEPIDQEELVVRLTTDARLVPVYLGPVKGQGTDAAYINKLEKVLRFDLSHNGMTDLLVPSPLLNALSIDPKDTSRWRENGVYYAIGVSIANGSLQASVLSANGNWIKGIDHLPLTGDIKQDRHQVHVLADLIHKALFGTEGIARTRFLYTVRERLPGQKQWVADIWEADYDGANAHQVLRNAGYCVTPQYIPAAPGKQPGSFCYVSYQAGQPKIYIASLNAGAGRRLTYLRGNQLMPTFNAQRDKIAFVSDVTGNPDLFIQDFSLDEGAIGKPRQIFSARLATQGTPTFSPDGKKIAFVSNKDGTPRIYAIDVPPEGAKLSDIKPKLLTRYQSATAPAWSPDGKKIAYCAQVDGYRQIFVYDFTKSHEHQLTQGKGNKENPTWAPNSLHLMYNCGEGECGDIYMINLHQPKAVRITEGKGEKRFPHWSPVGHSS